VEIALVTMIHLPNYSPDFNPIELAFRKLEPHLRKARPSERSRANPVSCGPRKCL
jgi:transposase